MYTDYLSDCIIDKWKTIISMMQNLHYIFFLHIVIAIIICW